MIHLKAKTLTSWKDIPLYWQIVFALILGTGLGILLSANHISTYHPTLIEHLAIPSNLVLKALRALATPLIFLAVLHAFLTANIPGRAGQRLVILLLTNTTVAIVIGILVANVLKPGLWGHLTLLKDTGQVQKAGAPWNLLADSVPDSLIKPLVDNNVLQLIFVALVFGIMLRERENRADCLP